MSAGLGTRGKSDTTHLRCDHRCEGECKQYLVELDYVASYSGGKSCVGGCGAVQRPVNI